MRCLLEPRLSGDHNKRYASLNESSMQSAVYLCLASLLLGRLSAYPSSLQKSDLSSLNWFNLFAPDGSIRKEELKQFPLYEYVYQDYEYGDQIWTDCGTSSYPIQLQSVFIDPSPPLRGSTLTVTTNVKYTQEINSGHVKILLKYKDFIPIVSKTMKVCDLVTYLGISCPLEPGTQEYTTTQSIPTYVPKGQYVGKVTATNSSVWRGTVVY